MYFFYSYHEIARHEKGWPVDILEDCLHAASSRKNRKRVLLLRMKQQPFPSVAQQFFHSYKINFLAQEMVI